MLNAKLTRAPSNDGGTFGVFTIHTTSLYSGELPYLDNRSNVSSIPPGSYKCRYSLSPRFKKYSYEVMGVPGRAGIRIHSANFMGNKEKGFKSQLNGCIALGLRVGVMENQTALLLSPPAIRKLEEITERQDFMLEIV